MRGASTLRPVAVGMKNSVALPRPDFLALVSRVEHAALGSHQHLVVRKRNGRGCESEPRDEDRVECFHVKLASNFVPLVLMPGAVAYRAAPGACWLPRAFR